MHKYKPPPINMGPGLADWMNKYGWSFLTVPDEVPAYFLHCLEPASLIMNRVQVLMAEPRLDSPPLRLPNEILLEIYSHLDDVTDQLSLTLSCKRFLQIGGMLLRGVKFPTVGPQKCMGNPYRPQMIEMLRRLCPRDSLGRRRLDVALCFDCLRYRAIKPDLWEDQGKKYHRLEPEIDTREEWEGNLSRWRARYSCQCPDCFLQERREELYYGEESIPLRRFGQKYWEERIEG